MTDTYAEEVLIREFKKLKGLQKVTLDGVTAYPEVAFPNESFERPNDGYWYELYFIPAVPNVIELGGTGRSRWLGLLQINVCVPKGVGSKPQNARFDNIAKLFRNGRMIDGVRIQKVYRDVAVDDGDFSTMPVTIQWQADMDR